MFSHAITAEHIPAKRPLRQIQTPRFKELIPMCIIRIQDSERNPSLLDLARRCKKVLDADLSPELEVMFVGLNREQLTNLAEIRAKLHLHTIGDFACAIYTFLAPGSDYCPNCGNKTFTEPVLFCESCGENPGRVFERARGISPTRSQ